ncbi:MAG TPA: DUF6580 family putative transport protein [Bacteroidota bacterium]|nr:DUF6580 family putative transport protein [Bacteroidota bacterium]
MKRSFDIRSSSLLLLMVTAGLYRLLNASGTISPLLNMTPVGAIALFGGHYFRDRWKAFAAPIGVLLLSDLFMNAFFYLHSWVLFYDGFLWTYGSFALMVVLGRLMERVRVRSVVTACVTAALAHWLITDLGVWLAHGTDITTGMPYSFDFAGLVKCYTLAIPYLEHMLAGNLIFGAILFGSFELLQRRLPALRLQQENDLDATIIMQE